MPLLLIFSILPLNQPKPSVFTFSKLYSAISCMPTHIPKKSLFFIITSSNKTSIKPWIFWSPSLQSGKEPTPGSTSRSEFFIDFKSLVTSTLKFKSFSKIEFLKAFPTDFKFPDP